jgi:hypothetical protein
MPIKLNYATRIEFNIKLITNLKYQVVYFNILKHFFPELNNKKIFIYIKV